MLRELFAAVTYRNSYTHQQPVGGLQVVTGRLGARIVCDLMVPAYLEAHRRRLVRDGLDPLDRMLLDASSAELLTVTAAASAQRWPIAA